jgi:hypothetical protein
MSSIETVEVAVELAREGVVDDKEPFMPIIRDVFGAAEGVGAVLSGLSV